MGSFAGAAPIEGRSHSCHKGPISQLPLPCFPCLNNNLRDRALRRQTVTNRFLLAVGEGVRELYLPTSFSALVLARGSSAKPASCATACPASNSGMAEHTVAAAVLPTSDICPTRPVRIRTLDLRSGSALAIHRTVDAIPGVGRGAFLQTVPSYTSRYGRDDRKSPTVRVARAIFPIF
jgi:hypothetical protein